MFIIKMSRMTSEFAVLTIFCFSISNVLANYCESGLCLTNQYCCDDNVCCIAFDTWLLIGCLLLAMVILSVGAACIYRYYCLNSSLRRNNSQLRLVPVRTADLKWENNTFNQTFTQSAASSNY